MGFLAMGLSTVAGWLGLTQLRVILGLVAVIGAGIVVTGAYVKGRMDQASICKEAALEQKIAGLERDLAAAGVAARTAEQARLAAEKNAKEDDARIAAYEVELKNRPEPRCTLTDDDLRGLFGGQR